MAAPTRSASPAPLDMAIDMAKADINARITADRAIARQRRRQRSARHDPCTASSVAARYLPDNIVTNDDLAKMVDTSDEWIRERTGIRQRHIVADGEKTSDLALGAARAALIDAGIDAGELDMIICCHHHAGRNLSRHRHRGAGAAGHDARRRLRRSGGMLRLHLWPVGGRQFDPRAARPTPSC